MKRELLDQAVRLSGIEALVGFLTEPEAAAVFYAHQERIEPARWSPSTATAWRCRTDPTPP